MSETFNTGDIVEITATGKIEVVYGDGKYLVRVHGETVPMLGLQMHKVDTDTGQRVDTFGSDQARIRGH